jgi:hypothetical protein
MNHPTKTNGQMTNKNQLDQLDQPRNSQTGVIIQLSNRKIGHTIIKQSTTQVINLKLNSRKKI